MAILPNYSVRLKFYASKYFNVFLQLKFSPFLYLDKISYLLTETI